MGARQHRFGIRARLILNVLALVALSLWLLGVMLLRQNVSFHRAELRARGRVIAAATVKTVVSLSAGNPRGFLASGSGRAAVRELLGALADGQDVESITLRDQNGALVTSSAAADGPDRGEGDALEFSYPLLLAGNAPAGSLAVRFSARSVRQQVAYSHLQVLVQLGISALILVIFLHLLISLAVVRPIHRLRTAMERIAGGDLDRPLEATARRDEIGDLAASFNLMLLKLSRSREINRRQFASLEQAHADLVAKERDLVRAEKMAAVGRVAAGVAHEMGNPLGAVTGYLAMLRGGGLSAAETRESLERTEREVARMHRIMTDLLDYARPPRMDRGEIELNSLLRDLRLHLGTQADFLNRRIELALEDGLPVVGGDYHRTRQMLLNLALNAAQAMPGGGTVCLETFRPRRAGFAAGVRVRDDGPGIPAEVLAHLFEPFTTAGKGGRGTGLGLAICRKTADAMGALLEVETAPGAGTTFTILFPEQPTPPPGAPPDGTAGGGVDSANG